MTVRPTPAGPRGLALADIQVELNILIFTMLINMGFLKLTEISVFITATVQTIAAPELQISNAWPLVLVVVAVVGYMVYVGAILVGVLQTFRKKNPRPAMCVSLVGFFVGYSCVFINSMSHV